MIRKVSLKEINKRFQSKVNIENPQYIKMKECGSKKQYFSKEQADKRNPGKEMHSYKCNFCNFYHLGH